MAHSFATSPAAEENDVSVPFSSCFVFYSWSSRSIRRARLLESSTKEYGIGREMQLFGLPFAHALLSVESIIQ